MLRVVVVALSFLFATSALARGGGHSSGYHAGSHSSTHSTKGSGSGYTSPSVGTTHGYITRKGTYVAPYHHTMPNRTRNDNFSTKGNYNPYTGKAGTKRRDGE